MCRKMLTKIIIVSRQKMITDAPTEAKKDKNGRGFKEKKSRTNV